MNRIKFTTGDATRPEGEGKKIIVHICNDIGAWGAGFVLALSKRWKEPEAAYRSKTKYELGTVEIVQVEDDIWVANMIAQQGTGPDAKGNPPIRYSALRKCLGDVDYRAWMMGEDTTIHMPRIGCGLAGGRWELVQEDIEAVVECPVTVYDLP